MATTTKPERKKTKKIAKISRERNREHKESGRISQSKQANVKKEKKMFHELAGRKPKKSEKSFIKYAHS